MAGAFHAAELHGVLPSSRACLWDQLEEARWCNFCGAWCCSGLINWIKTAVLLQSNTFFPLGFHWLRSVSHPVTVLPGRRVHLCGWVCLFGSFSSSKDYANSNWIKELLSTLSDSGKGIPCYRSACRLTVFRGLGLVEAHQDSLICESFLSGCLQDILPTPFAQLRCV